MAFGKRSRATRNEIKRPCQNEKKRIALTHKNFGMGLFWGRTMLVHVKGCNN